MSGPALFARVHQVGIAVRDLSASAAWFVDRGATPVGGVYADLLQESTY